MARKRSFHIPTKPLPSAKKIAKRGVYELISGNGKTKTRNYKKRAETGKY